MRDVGEPEGVEFGTWIKAARIAKPWTQEQLMAEADLSKSTVNRWENLKGLGSIDSIRRACVALGLDPREAAVKIGLVTREEWDLPPAPPIDRGLADAARFLADGKLSEDEKNYLRETIEGAIKFWLNQLGVRRNREPSAAERGGKKPAPRK